MKPSYIVLALLNILAIIGIVIHSNGYFIPDSDDKSMLVPVFFFFLLFIMNSILLIVFYFLKRVEMVRIQKRVVGFVFLIGVVGVMIYSAF